MAGPAILDTFSHERQPIGEKVIRRANQGLRDHYAMWEALGVLPADVEERKRQHAELKAATPEGRARRKRLHDAVAYSQHEFGAIGVEMNQLYQSSAIYAADEDEPPSPPADPVLEYQISTYPGSRVPHAWLNQKCPEEPISTIDLAGHGAFCILTGIGGEGWKTAAAEVSRDLDVPINAYSIGWGQDWEDMYGEWHVKRETEEDGCVLLRPDRTVCWRSMSARDDASATLRVVLESVLSRGK
jgi:hypothetical protein